MGVLWLCGSWSLWAKARKGGWVSKCVGREGCIQVCVCASVLVCGGGGGRGGGWCGGWVAGLGKLDLCACVRGCACDRIWVNGRCLAAEKGGGV